MSQWFDMEVEKKVKETRMDITDDKELWDTSNCLKAPTNGRNDVVDAMDPKGNVSKRKLKLHVIPPVALLEMSKALTDGAYTKKYGLMNWRNGPVKASVYYDGIMRHLLSYWDGEELTRDSLVQHLASAMAGLAIMIDALSVGTLHDDRPSVKGHAADVLEAALKGE